MQVQCIAPFGDSVPGDVIDVPDDSEVCPFWFVPVDASTPPAGDGSGFPPAA